MESQTSSKRVLWQDREGRLQAGMWESKRACFSERSCVERSTVLSAGNRPDVWLAPREVPTLRALLDRPDAPSTQRHFLDRIAEEAAALLSLPEEERVATDQRVLQFARVLEAGIRFRQEPPTDACTRAAWASVGHRHIVTIAAQITDRASPDPDRSELATPSTHDTAPNWRPQYNPRVVLMRPYSLGYARQMRRLYEPQYAVRRLYCAAQR